MGLLPVAGGVACGGGEMGFLLSGSEGVLEACFGFRVFFSGGGGAIPAFEKASFRFRAKLPRASQHRRKFPGRGGGSVLSRPLRAQTQSFPAIALPITISSYSTSSWSTFGSSLLRRTMQS